MECENVRCWKSRNNRKRDGKNQTEHPRNLRTPVEGARTSDDTKRRKVYNGGEQPGQSGVGILLEKETAKSLIGYNPISDKILIVRIQGRKKNMALIQAYAPTSSSEIEEAEEFYAALQHTQTGLLGDFNAKIGHEMSREEKEVKGIHCLGNLLTCPKKVAWRLLILFMLNLVVSASCNSFG